MSTATAKPGPFLPAELWARSACACPCVCALCDVGQGRDSAPIPVGEVYESDSDEALRAWSASVWASGGEE